MSDYRELTARFDEVVSVEMFGLGARQSLSVMPSSYDVLAALDCATLPWASPAPSRDDPGSRAEPYAAF